MSTLKNRVAIAALAGAAAFSIVTPTQARNNAWAAAGAGFAAGTILGAAAANANANAYYGPYGYYGPGYGYYGAGYPTYSYGYAAPAYDYAYVAPTYTYEVPYASGYAYAPAGAYSYAAPYDSYRGGLNGSAGISVYDNGHYVGSDPDPRVRASISQEERGRD